MERNDLYQHDTQGRLSSEDRLMMGNNMSSPEKKVGR